MSNPCRGKSEYASDTLLFVFQSEFFSQEHPNKQDSRCSPIFGKSDTTINVVESSKENIQRTLVVESNKYIIYTAPKDIWLVSNVNVCESLINNVHYYTQVSDNNELSSNWLIQIVLNNIKKQTRPK